MVPCIISVYFFRRLWVHILYTSNIFQLRLSKILDKESKGTELGFLVKFRKSCKRSQIFFLEAVGSPTLSLGLEYGLGAGSWGWGVQIDTYFKLIKQTETKACSKFQGYVLPFRSSLVFLMTGTAVGEQGEGCFKALCSFL